MGWSNPWAKAPHAHMCYFQLDCRTSKGTTLCAFMSEPRCVTLYNYVCLSIKPYVCRTCEPHELSEVGEQLCFLGLCFNTFYVIEIELDYLRNYVTGITFTSLWLSLITQTFLAEVVWLGWITFTYSWPSLMKCACFCWAWSPLRRYDWPRSLLFLSLNLITFTPVPASLFTFAFRVWASSFLWYLADVEHLCPRDVSLGDNVRIYCQYNCTVQPLSPLQGLLDQKGGGGGRTALCLVSMLSVAWLLSHFCYRNHLHIFMAEIDHFHFF